MSTLSKQKYDVVIIGAGMAGLAAGIRLAMYDYSVLILERHEAAGGLNSFYSLGGRRYDVGLHAMTNYVAPGVKGTALVKLLRQLRIGRDEFALAQQRQSRVVFPGGDLAFSNDFALFESEVARLFPGQVDAFVSLVAYVREYDEVNLQAGETSAKAVLQTYLSDPLLIDMILCPLMYYGSSQENDMDWGQFVIMFKSIFLEGFARPYEGVRRIIRALTKKYKSLGGERKMRLGVKELVVKAGRVHHLLLDDGQEIEATHVLSSIGAVETARLRSDAEADAEASNVGQLSFVETITVLDEQPAQMGWSDTILFFCDEERFRYQKPEGLVDLHSGVICFPNNYEYEQGRLLDAGYLRVTAMANYQQWKALPQEAYGEAKHLWYTKLQDQAMAVLGSAGKDLAAHTLAKDMFTPTTVRRFTGHLNGAIYGATYKNKLGSTDVSNLYICGTDQGFLGIVGAMLSGISMANLHVLTGAK